MIDDFVVRRRKKRTKTVDEIRFFIFGYVFVYVKKLYRKSGSSRLYIYRERD
jgi:hypothetical protein